MRLLPIGRPVSRAPLTGEARLARAQSAFRAHFDALFARGLSFAARWAGADAEDVVMEAFANLWEACYADGDFDDDPVENLFFLCLRRRIVDHLRHQEIVAATDERHVLNLTARIESLQSPTRVADGNQLADRIAYIVSSLPPQTRRVFEIAQSNDYDAHAPMRELHIAYNTARWHLREATSRIREQLERDGYQVPAALLRGRRSKST